MDDWSEERALALISHYRDHPNLWDPKDGNYYNKNMKEESWNQISLALDKPADICKNKMLSLLSSNRRENSKRRKSKLSGRGIYRSRWYAFEALRFLEGRICHNKLTNRNQEDNEEEDNISDEQEERTDEHEAESIDEAAHSQNFISLKPTKVFMHDAANVDLASQSKCFAPSQLRKRQCREYPAARPEATSTATSDEIESFCAFLSAKMASYTAEARKAVQHAIFKELMIADGGYYDRGSSQNSNYWINGQHSSPDSPKTTDNQQAAAVFRLVELPKASTPCSSEIDEDFKDLI